MSSIKKLIISISFLVYFLKIDFQKKAKFFYRFKFFYDLKKVPFFHVKKRVHFFNYVWGRITNPTFFP